MRTTKMMSVLFLALALSGFSATALAFECSATNPQPGCCVVRSGSDSDTAMHTLREAINQYNYGDDAGEYAPWRQCSKGIVFATGAQEPVIRLKKSLVLDYTGDQTEEFVIGNSSTNFIVRADFSGAEGEDAPAIFDFRGVKNVRIRNVKIHGSSNLNVLFAKGRISSKNGQQGQNIVLENVIFNNRPVRAIDFQDYNNVKVIVSNTGQTETEEAVAGDETTPFLRFHNIGKEDDAVALELDVNLQQVKGTAISVSADTLGDNFNVAVTGQVSGPSSENGNTTALDLRSVNINSLSGFTAQNVTSGIVLNNVRAEAPITGVTLSGNSARLAGTGSLGQGLFLDQEVNGVSFSGFNISYFNGDGVVIRDGSNNNTIRDFTITQNSGNGITIDDVANGNIVEGNDSIYNGGFGLFLDSPRQNKIKANELGNNARGPFGLGDQAKGFELVGTSVKVIPIASDRIKLDVAQNLINDNPFVATLELHRKTIAPFSVGGGDIPDRELGDGDSELTGASLVPGASDVSVDRLPCPTGECEFEGTFDADYVALLRNEDGYLVRVWTGVRIDDRCYEDRIGDGGAQYLVRIYNPTLDSDGDGLLDFQEDRDSDCTADDNETLVDLVDSDADGLTDLEEVETEFGGRGLTGGVTHDSDHDGTVDARDPDSDDDKIFDGNEEKDKEKGTIKYKGPNFTEPFETDPLNPDTDGDTLSDGREDVNLNGVLDANETDPRHVDTDRDNRNDNNDDCPLIGTDTDAVCYFDGCVPGVRPYDTQDTDGDGLYDYQEDTNFSCTRETELGETDPSISDSDGDGLTDYQEVVITKTEAANPDTDGDCIMDGSEDRDGDGYINLNGGETNPKSIDSDGDGLYDGNIYEVTRFDSVSDFYASINAQIADNPDKTARLFDIEDFNCNGDVDDGESSPSLKDTDGDGLFDGVDTCPLDQNPNCNIRFCGVSAMSNVDSDGDGITDFDEDSDGNCMFNLSERESNPLDSDSDDDLLNDQLESCFKTNPNIADTDADGRTDYQEVAPGDKGESCVVRFNEGDSNPLRGEFGNCSLNTAGAGMGDLMALMAGGTTLLMLSIRRRLAK